MSKIINYFINPLRRRFFYGMVTTAAIAIGGAYLVTRSINSSIEKINEVNYEMNKFRKEIPLVIDRVIKSECKKRGLEHFGEDIQGLQKEMEEARKEALESHSSGWGGWETKSPFK